MWSSYPLQAQQQSFHLKPVAEATEAAVAADYPMAGNDNRQRVSG
jgi:hypothetical protein